MLKNEKGITLIALIITIIVMLILVGVTINVAINGGLFEKAEDAAEQTQMAAEKEQLIMAALGVFDVNTGVDFDELELELPEGFREISIDATKAVYEGPSGKQYEVIKETGKVSETPNGEDENEDDDPPENTIPTVWQERHVTSTNVKFDTLYYSSDVILAGHSNGLSICLFENGDICVNFSAFGENLLDPFDEEGNHILGNGGVDSATADTYLLTPGSPMKGFENGITFPYDSDDTVTIRYTSDNKINVYYKDVDDTSIELVDGNVPENDAYLVGTLLPQE